MIGKDIEKTRDPIVCQRLQVPDGWKYEHGTAEGGNGYLKPSLDLYPPLMRGPIGNLNEYPRGLGNVFRETGGKRHHRSGTLWQVHISTIDGNLWLNFQSDIGGSDGETRHLEDSSTSS
jgi:hypothetical protein